MGQTDDIVAVLQLVAAFNHCVDFGAGEPFADLFVAEGVLDMGHLRVVGHAALAEFASGVPDRVPNPRHVVSNTWVQADGDAATARSYAQVFITEPGKPTTLKNAGRYDDELVRTDVGWRFVQRTFLPDR